MSSQSRGHVTNTVAPPAVMANHGPKDGQSTDQELSLHAHTLDYLCSFMDFFPLVLLFCLRLYFFKNKE